jgi:hypothetical protein
MARQKKNSLMYGATGKVGNVVFRRLHDQTIISAKPAKSSIPRSEKQKAQAKKMKIANNYARVMMEDPAMEKEYSSGVTENLRNAYRVAVADFMNAPKVHEIRTTEYTGAPGDVIKIKAVDDFKVMKVLVSITDSNGTLIEEGEAVQYFNRPTFWKYHITTTNPGVKGTRIHVTAFDRPKNKGVLEIVL